MWEIVISIRFIFIYLCSKLGRILFTQLLISNENNYNFSLKKLYYIKNTKWRKSEYNHTVIFHYSIKEMYRFIFTIIYKVFMSNCHSNQSTHISKQN